MIFWHLLTWACVIWYSSITVHVAVRGWSDIRGMLRRLGKDQGSTAHPHKE